MGVPRRKQLRIILWIAFALYCACMLWLLFGQRLSAVSSRSYWEQLRNNYNLIPTYTISEYLSLLRHTDSPALVRHAWINLAGNVITFIPLGFFLPALWPCLRRFWRCLLCCAGIIVLIELVQLFTLLGSCDVDDLILNLPGCVLGFLLFSLLRKFQKK